MTRGSKGKKSSSLMGKFSSNFSSDFLASISVALVALPLALGVAEASQVPPISGVICAIVGGLVATLFRGSRLAINGPGAGLIAVILDTRYSLEDGSANIYPYILAVICVSGAIQVLLGLFKLGVIAEMIPSSVIKGVMAGIGFIIISTQIHHLLGIDSITEKPIDRLLEALSNLNHSNWLIAALSAVCLAILFIVPRLKSKVFRFLPASLWVIFFAILFSYFFGFQDKQTFHLMEMSFSLGPDYLIAIPSNIIDAITFPNFSQWNAFGFWKSVISLTLISTIQTLAMTKAVDKLDPHKRRTNLNKDLVGVGIASMVSGALGGLPVITVIVRSSVNISNNAKTKWSNFYHGLMILLFVLFLTPYINLIPLAALAAILAFVGLRLVSPKSFKETYQLGLEQLIFMLSTFIMVLYTDLLTGILFGTFITLLVHILLSHLPIILFFRSVFSDNNKTIKRKDNSYLLQFEGITNFLSILSMDKKLEKITPKKDITLDFSKSRLIDMTSLEYLFDYKKNYEQMGGITRITGLENHISYSAHPLSLKVQVELIYQKLNVRQEAIKNLAEHFEAAYRKFVAPEILVFDQFLFFEKRPLEKCENVIEGRFKNYKWTLSDLTFLGGFIANFTDETYISTAFVIECHHRLPQFILTQEGTLDKWIEKVLPKSFNDISLEDSYDEDVFQWYQKFFGVYNLEGKEHQKINQLFSKNLRKSLIDNPILYMESDGNNILMIHRLKPSRIDEIKGLIPLADIVIHCLEEYKQISL